MITVGTTYTLITCKICTGPSITVVGTDKGRYFSKQYGFHTKTLMSGS